MIDAVTGFIQNIVESATKPIVDGVFGYLTTTPTLLDNSVVKDFWLISVGVVDSLFVVVAAMLGLQLMGADTFGFEQVEFKQLLPRLGLAFLGANTSLFLANYAILNSTGGLNRAWVVDSINPATILTGTAPLIILIFLVIFLIVSIVLLLLYISRLIFISLGAVLSPFVFLLWAMPFTSDFARVAAKTYLTSVFMVFVHVVTIQLAGSFLALPENNQNPLISIAVAIGLFTTLLKTPSIMMQMVFYTSKARALTKLGNQVINVMSTDRSAASRSTSGPVKLPRKVIKG